MEHYPVLLEAALEYLAIREDGLYVDATAGLGGHSGEIARRLMSGRVVASDRDLESLEKASQNTAEWLDRITFLQSRFSVLPTKLAEAGFGAAEGLLVDLGVSRYQLTNPERGFSLLAAGFPDMRMNRSEGETAADILNFTAEKALADLIYHLGEERRAKRISRAIVRARPIRSTLHLANVIEEAVPRTGRIHPATQTFMALRMAVNEEPAELEALLASIPKLVKPGGRAVIITFMSLEDRKVKQAFQALAREGRARILTKHVIRPGDRETAENPPSRSAKLRAIELQ
jgi:16S rRNA (cytosine1402-N4)-methyltransferase